MIVRSGCILPAVFFVVLSASQIGICQKASSVRTITLNAVAGLQFDKVRFSVKPGEPVKIVLNNKDDMSHNMVITEPGARMKVVDASMKLEEKGPQMDFIPEMREVLWSIAVLAPGETKSVTFNAPKIEGVYPYVCTFPGHGFSMYGAMYVSSDENMPGLAADENLPESRRKGAATDNSAHSSHTVASRSHPYELTPPCLYRAYMEDASPASIAVNLPGGISYCWDASTCELRYAWTGDFVDNTGLWKGKPNAVAKVLGEKFFSIRMRSPLRTGNPESVPVSEYKGYRLVDRYPEFHYTINGVDVYELIKANEDGTALIRTFRIPHGSTDVWFLKHPSDGVGYESSSGKWQSDRIKISGQHARNFTITMIKKEGK